VNDQIYIIVAIF